MKTIFLDRDGVINENLDNDYVKNLDEFKFIPKAKEAIKMISDNDWDIIIISNQSGIGKGIMSASMVEKINSYMIHEIENFGGKIKAVYYCHHRSDENCECRKPKPGMIIQACSQFGIKSSESYLIGDKITDIQAGAEVGCTTILVKTGWGREQSEKLDQYQIKPDYIVSDLFDAVKLLLNLSRI